MKKAGDGTGGSSASSAAARRAALRQMMKAEQQRQAAAQNQHYPSAGTGPAHRAAPAQAQAQALLSAVAAPAQPSKGVLKKSKYSAAPAPVAAKNDGSDGNSDNDGGGLANLLGGYDSSSDEEEAHANANTSQGPTVASAAPAPAPASAARSASAPSADIASAAASVALETTEEVVDQPAAAAELAAPEATGGPNKSSEDAMVDDDTWKEFEDLVGSEDDDEDVKEQGTGEASKPIGESADADTGGDGVQDSNGQANAGTDLAAEHQPSTATTAAVDTSEVEQAAYEARLSRLMMLRAAKAKKSADTPGTGVDQGNATNNMDALKDVEYASAGLAFGGEGEEEEASSAKPSANLELSSQDVKVSMKKKRRLPGSSSASSSALAIMKRKKAKMKQIATDADMVAEYGEDDLGGFA